MPNTGARRWRTLALTTITALILGFGGCVALQRAKPYLLGDGCQVTVSGQAIQLDSEQAAIAATIAGVGYRRGLPGDAVTVAYATALQESHLHNVGYGDRDSIGIFQQRPSQGWGTASELKDPVYATTRFFAALVKVRGYQRMPVDRAAQAVQHSADGGAYEKYQQVAKLLSAGFTGDASHAVWCWYTPYPTRPSMLPAAMSQLSRTFGRLTGRAAIDTAVARSTAPALSVNVPRSQTGWAVASWSVAHAKAYGITNVRYAGYEWLAGGGRGWEHDSRAPGDGVALS